MPLIPVSDLDDPRLAVYRSLKATNETRRLGLFVVEGARLVDRLLTSRFPAASVLVTDRYSHRLAGTVPLEVPTYILPHALIRELVGFPFHRGILACALRRPWPPLDSIVTSRERPLTLVICPRISNPENLGA